MGNKDREAEKGEVMRVTEYFTKACDPKTMTARQLMEDGVVTVRPESTGLAIAELLSERQFGSVPVVEHDQTLIGLVSEFDLLLVMDQDKDLREVTAADMMPRDVVTITEEMPVKDLIHLLQERHLIRVQLSEARPLLVLWLDEILSTGT